jgi:hypothetical protein
METRVGGARRDKGVGSSDARNWEGAELREAVRGTGKVDRVL